MDGWYTNVPDSMLCHARVVHRRTSLNVVPMPGGTLTYQFECFTMARLYTNVPGQMLYHGWVVHRHTRLNVVLQPSGTPT